MQEKLQIQIWSTSSNRKSKPPHPIRSTASWTCHFKRFLSHLLWVFLGGVWTLITHSHHWQNRLFLYFSCNSLLYNRKLHVLLCLLLRRLKNCTWFTLPPEDVSYASAHPRWLCPDSEESKPSSKGDCSHGVQCSSRETDNAKLRIRLTLLILMATLFFTSTFQWNDYLLISMVLSNKKNANPFLQDCYHLLVSKCHAFSSTLIFTFWFADNVASLGRPFWNMILMSVTVPSLFCVICRMTPVTLFYHQVHEVKSRKQNQTKETLLNISFIFENMSLTINQ